MNTVAVTCQERIKFLSLRLSGSFLLLQLPWLDGYRGASTFHTPLFIVVVANYFAGPTRVST